MNPKDRNDTSFLNFSSWTFGRRFCSNQRPCPWWVWELSIILFSALFSSKLLQIWGGKNYIGIHNFIQSRHDYSSFIHGISTLDLENSSPWRINKFFDPTDPMEKRENVCQLCWNVERTWDANIPNLNGHSMTIPKWCRSDGHWTWQFPTWNLRVG